MLSGPSLSGVQVLGLHLLDRHEQRAEVKSEFDAIKRALLTARPKLMGALFPDLMPESEREEPEPPPSVEPPSEDEVADMEAWLNKAMRGGATMGSSELYGPDEGWQ